MYFLYELGILLLRIAPAKVVAEGGIIGRMKSDKRSQKQLPDATDEDEDEKNDAT